MFASFIAASWKARLLNLFIWALLFSSIIGCGIAFLSVLQEGTQNNSTSDIWQFYWNGVQDELLWINYSDMDPTVASNCQNGGRALIALEIITLFALVPAIILLTIRISGVHVSRLQPTAKWINVEFYLTLFATVGQFFSCLAWGATCYHSSAQIAVFSEMTPTGFIWLILCIGYLIVNSIALGFVIRTNSDYQLGSVYGHQFDQTEKVEVLTSGETVTMSD